MKKGVVKTVQINPEIIKSNIKAAGYSLRSLAPVIGVDRRTIMSWLKRGEMPEYLLELIDDEVRPKKKEIWIRIGMTVPVTDDELFEIMEFAQRDHCRYMGAYARDNGMSDYVLGDDESEQFARRGKADGESYIPEVILNEHINWWLEERKRRGIK